MSIQWRTIRCFFIHHYKRSVSNEKRNKNANPSDDVEIQRGTITDNALKALVTSPVFKMRVEKPKKGKGSFQRKAKHQVREPYSKAA